MGVYFPSLARALSVDFTDALTQVKGCQEFVLSHTNDSLQTWDSTLGLPERWAHSVPPRLKETLPGCLRPSLPCPQYQTQGVSVVFHIIN